MADPVRVHKGAKARLWLNDEIHFGDRDGGKLRVLEFHYPVQRGNRPQEPDGVVFLVRSDNHPDGRKSQVVQRDDFCSAYIMGERFRITVLNFFLESKGPRVLIRLDR